MPSVLRLLLWDRRGVSALEYSLLVGAMVLGMVATINTSQIQQGIVTTYGAISQAMADH